MSMKHQTIVLVIAVIIMSNYKVVEKFVSINGEGARAGQLAVFIRFYGCNLHCSYCDTLYASDPQAAYELMSATDILAYIDQQLVTNVTLTGGEPLLQKDLNVLIKLLLKHGYQVEIETNGSIDIQPFISEGRPFFTLDYKVYSSKMENYMNLNNYQYLTKNDVVKFVVGKIEDLDQARNIIEQYDLNNRVQVFFSPIFGMIDPATIVDYMLKYHLNQVKLQLQLHKFIWDVNARGV